MISNSIAITLQKDALSLRKDENSVFNGFESKLIKVFSGLADFLVRKFLLPKLDLVVSAQAELALKFSGTIQTIEQSEGEGVIDEDFEIRESLDRLKATMVDFREHCIMFETEITLSPLSIRAFAKAKRVSQELYASATALQWAIAEHDSDLSDRLEGFTASSAKEAEDILNKILAAA